MPRTQGWEISKECATAVEALRKCGLELFADLVAEWRPDDVEPEAMTDLHRKLRREALAQADRAYGILLVWLLASTNLDRLATTAVRETDDRRLVNKGLSRVSVTLPSGVEVPLEVTYLLHQEKRRAGRAKRHGNRGADGAGCYPVLETLGFDSQRRLSPLVEEAILHTGTACDDFRTGWTMADSFECKMSWKGYASRFRRLAADVREGHDDWLFDEHGPPLFDARRWAKKRVVIASDGGRTRLREDHKGPPKKNGWRDFDAEWREPKLFIIYAIDDGGEPLCEPEPIIDGTFGDADEVFARLEATLTHLEIWNAAEVVFLGDGAQWIWNRARPMLERIGVAPEAIFEGVDFYHAVSALCKLSELPDWETPAKIRWRNRARKALKAGDITKVATMIDKLAEHEGAEEAADKKSYFTDNEERMQFQRRRAMNLPEGSGAMESAIRRVVNLRMKGNGKFWKEENAEAMITLRSHLKTGRFHRLISWWRQKRTHWWTAGDRRRLQTSDKRYFGAITNQRPRKVA